MVLPNENDRSFNRTLADLLDAIERPLDPHWYNTYSKFRRLPKREPVEINRVSVLPMGLACRIRVSNGFSAGFPGADPNDIC